MRKIRFTIPFLLVLALSLTAAPPSDAQQNSPVALTIRAGYDGFIKENMWLPVRVIVANEGPDVIGSLEIEVTRYDGGTVRYTRPIELPQQSRKEVFMYAAAEGFLNRVQVNLLQDDEVLADATTRVSQIGDADLLYGVIAGSPSAFQNLGDIDPFNGQGYFAQLDLDDLPPASAAWRSLDVLLFSDTDTGGLSPAQTAALDTWIAAGGRLILAGGPGWQRTLAGLGDLSPVSLTGTATLTDLEALGAYTFSEPPEGPAQITTGDPVQSAEVLLEIEDVPVIIERSVGYGAIDYLAFDPALAPFNGWSGMTGVYRNLLADPSQPPSWTHPQRNWFNAGEAVNAVPGVDLPSIWQMCAFAGAYVFVVGPLNFILLRRMRKQEYAWLTVPGFVILFSAISFLAGFAFRGTRPILHRLGVVQVWEGAERAQVEMVVGLFSPRRATYDVMVSGDALIGPIPETGFSGPAGASIDETTLESGERALVRDMQVDVGAVTSFVVSGQMAAPLFSSELIYEFDDPRTSGETIGGSVKLQGSVTNLTDFTLQDAVLLAPSSVQSLGDLVPGEPVDVTVRLSTGRAAPGVLLGAAQVLPAGAVAGPFTRSGYSGTYDTTIDDILSGSGSSISYYDDRKIYRRFSLLQWLVDPNRGGARGSGLFLVGWVNQAPLDARIVDRPFETEDETLYIVNLVPTTSSESGVIAIPPELMTWELLDPGSGSGDGPYDVYLYDGAYSLRFQPQPELAFGEVQRLVMHLHSYGANELVPLIISLREQQSGDWVELPPMDWGNIEIAAPERFVGNGRIDVRVENKSTTGRVSIERLDFTLEVEQ